MLDIGWPEFAVVLIVALLVIGPRDLPRALYTVGKWVRSARKVAHEFQRHVDDMMREAELDDLKKGVQAARNLNVKKQLQDAIDPTGDLKSALDPTGIGKPGADAGKGNPVANKPVATGGEKLEAADGAKAADPAIAKKAAAGPSDPQARDSVASETEPPAKSAPPSSKAAAKTRTPRAKKAAADGAPAKSDGPQKATKATGKTTGGRRKSAAKQDTAPTSKDVSASTGDGGKEASTTKAPASTRRRKAAASPAPSSPSSADAGDSATPGDSGL